MPGLRPPQTSELSEVLSVSNRILLLSMLAKGKTEIQNLLDSDDIRYMVEGMKKLGIKLFACNIKPKPSPHLFS